MFVFNQIGLPILADAKINLMFTAFIAGQRIETRQS
jgi:hypothetical protein